MERQDLAPGIFTICDVLTAHECRRGLAYAERRGFDVAPINVADGARFDKETRNNGPVIVDDDDIASWLWGRVVTFVPLVLADRRVRRLSERLGFYRYTPGQRSVRHSHRSCDGRQDAGLLTFMIYLNDGYEGGETRFESVSVAGKLGMALLFEHELPHEIAEITRGVQYVLRSDVMYEPDLTSQWRAYEDLYRGRNEAMIAFVARIAPIAVAEKIHPNNRHFWLGLRKLYRSTAVYLLCSHDGEWFGIMWYKDANLVKSETVKGIDSACWQRIVSWLDSQNQMQA